MKADRTHDQVTALPPRAIIGRDDESPNSEDEARDLAAAWRAGEEARDEDFDQFMPHEDQRVSASYWTPMPVAMIAAQWLDYFGAHSVVDVGSGVGKFCIVAALGGRPGSPASSTARVWSQRRVSSRGRSKSKTESTSFSRR
jgi:hypothetical protein